MSKIHITTYPSLKDTTTRPHDMSLEKLCEYLTTSERISDKTHATKLFSCARYTPGAKRGTEGVTHMTGVVCDFDFKESLTSTTMIGPQYIENLLKTYEIEPYQHIWYTTFSYTPERPNFRLILPFAPDAELTAEEYTTRIHHIFELFDHHFALDPCVKKLAQFYYGPCVNATKNSADFLSGTNITGEFYSLPLTPEVTPSEAVTPIRTMTDTYEVTPRNYDLVTAALQYISPDMPYDTWITIGMALKTEFGERGYDIWCNWSAGGDKFAHNRPTQMQGHWRSFNQCKVDGGHIVKLAKANRFDPKTITGRNAGHHQNVTPIRTDIIIKEAPVTEEARGSAFLDDATMFDKVDLCDFSDCPLLDWLNNQYLRNTNPSLYKLRIACIMPLAAHLLKETYHLPGFIPTFCLVIMRTAGGKLFFRTTTQAILKNFSLDHQELGDVGSLQALYQFQDDTDCHVFNLIDEVAENFKEQKSTGSAHVFGIRKAERELSDGGSYTQRAFKNIGGKTFEKPVFNSLKMGAENVFDYFTEEDFISGTLNRIHIFEDKTDVPSGIIIDGEDNEPDDIVLDPIPQFVYSFGSKIRYTSDAREHLNAFTLYIREKEKGFQETDPERYLLGRAAHMAKKAAILRCDTRGKVSLSAAKWGVGVTLMSLRDKYDMIQERYRIESHYKDRLEVHHRIQKLLSDQSEKHLTKRLLMRSLKKLSTKRIELALDRLEQEGRIDIADVVNKRGLPSTVITLLQKSTK